MMSATCSTSFLESLRVRFFSLIPLVAESLAATGGTEDC